MERMLGIPIEFANGSEEFRSAAVPRLAYTHHAIDGTVHVPWTGAIDDLPSGEPPFGTWNDLPVLFRTNQGHDLFAGTFYLLSLVNEIGTTDRDDHGRIPANALFTVRSGLADRPVVDEWAMQLAAAIEQCYPSFTGVKRTYRHVVTLDVDNLLRYAGRPLVRAVGATLNDLFRGRLASVADRWLVRTGARRDPYLRALDLIARCSPECDRSILFLLLKGNGAYDHAAHLTPSALHSLGRARDAGVELGLHPSYLSSSSVELLHQESALLKDRLGSDHHLSRQHFLRWNLPGTLRQLSTMGVTEEHSLGFHDRAGFRAATCTPFLWYDLEREEVSNLMLWPFIAMDSALIERQGLDADHVASTMNDFSDRVRAVRGTFVSVWHDRYLSGHAEFAAWPSVFEQVVRHARR